MIEGQGSRTALMVAGYRARASGRADPLINDPWAHELAGSEGLELARAHDSPMPHGELYIALRTAWIDDRLRSLIETINQVVILGAGLDTRAARLAKPGVTFFEVDHPATQREKRRKISTLVDYPQQAARWVTCDFEREDFLERLGDDGFDLGRPALFVWEGVTAYLTESAIEATLSRVARCDPGTVLIFDYIGKRMVAGVGREIDRDMNTLVASLGEPFRWGTHDPLPICAKAGFRHVRAVNFDQICLSLHGDYVRERTFRFVGIAMASRSVDLDP